MLIPGIVLSVVGVGFCCWLLFTLAVYALPFFTGLTAALVAFHVGSGVIGALVIGVLAGGTTLAIGQMAFATAPTPLTRAAIALLYAAPAAIAGYHAALGLALIAIPSTAWREAFAIFGAMFVGGTAFVRMGAMATRPLPSKLAPQAPARPRLMTATNQAVKQADPSSRL